MKPIRIHEVESLVTMLNRYMEHFEPDEPDEDEDLAILHERISDAYEKFCPKPVTFDPEILNTITPAETEAIHELIEELVCVFGRMGVSSEEKHQFEWLCQFYKRLVPAWEGPKSLNIALRY